MPKSLALLAMGLAFVLIGIIQLLNLPLSRRLRIIYTPPERTRTFQTTALSIGGGLIVVGIW